MGTKKMNIQSSASRGVVSAPHRLAAKVGADLLAGGANAIEAAIGVSAALSVVYPHMTGIGGDAFWLISDGSSQSVRGLAAAGPAGSAYDSDIFLKLGMNNIPYRGALSAMTVPGMLRGWQEAHTFSQRAWGGQMPWRVILAPAQELASSGFPVSESQLRNLYQYDKDLQGDVDFQTQFANVEMRANHRQAWRQPALARTLARLMENGPAEFYEGDLAYEMLQSLVDKGSRLSTGDLRNFHAEWVDPLRMPFAGGELINLPPPTQGIASLLIAGMMERAGLAKADPLGAELVHGAVEATKRVFSWRDRIIQDPHFDHATLDICSDLLNGSFLDQQAKRILIPEASHENQWKSSPGDTTWFGVVDAAGRVVSVIQSLYHEFGSGVVAGATGVLWNNRGCAFSLEPGDTRQLLPGKRPFHTLNPALYVKDNRVCLAFGSMGGDGQPQTQAAILFRYLFHGHDPVGAIDAPRWLLGRTWGDPVTALRLESRYTTEVVSRLKRWGHVIQMVSPYNDVMGHAGMLCMDRQGVWFGASDPRSDGSAIALP